MVEKILVSSYTIVLGCYCYKVKMKNKAKNKTPQPSYNNGHKNYRDKVCRVTPPVYGTNWWILIYLKRKKFFTNIFPCFAVLAKQQECLIIKDTEEMQYVYFKICGKEELIVNKCANQTLFVWGFIPINSDRKNKTSYC